MNYGVDFYALPNDVIIELNLYIGLIVFMNM